MWEVGVGREEESNGRKMGTAIEQQLRKKIQPFDYWAIPPFCSLNLVISDYHIMLPNVKH